MGSFRDPLQLDRIRVVILHFTLSPINKNFTSSLQRYKTTQDQTIQSSNFCSVNFDFRTRLFLEKFYKLNILSCNSCLQVLVHHCLPIRCVILVSGWESVTSIFSKSKTVPDTYILWFACLKSKCKNVFIFAVCERLQKGTIFGKVFQNYFCQAPQRSSSSEKWVAHYYQNARKLVQKKHRRKK